MGRLLESRVFFPHEGQQATREAASARLAGHSVDLLPPDECSPYYWLLVWRVAPEVES